MRYVIISLILIMLFSSLASGVDSLNVELVGQTLGAANVIFVDKDLAYLCAGSYLVVLDVTDPSRSAEMERIQTPGYARGVYVSEGYAFVADLDAGLRVIDVSNPKAPKEVGFCDTPGYAKGVYVSGSYAFVADFGLRVIDVSDPKVPKEVGFYDTPGSAYGVYVSGSYAFVADGDGSLCILSSAFIKGESVNSKGKQPTVWGKVKVTALFQNYPNPFNPETWIPFSLSGTANVVINIYSSTGEHVRTLRLGNKPEGLYIDKEKSAYWDGKNEAGESVSSGIYFYSITAGDFIDTRKMTIIR